MTVETAGPELIGRGAAEGKRLFREWFDRLSAAPAHGEKSAYVFVMGSLVELLGCFDLHTIFPEINSLQTAVRKQSADLLAAAEDYGYSPDICGYVKADVAVQLQQGRHPMGTIPRPDVAVLTNACNTYLKWAEIWERLHGTPMLVVDVPGSRSAGDVGRDDPDAFDRDRRYVQAQLEEVIAACATLTGVPFDIDRLRERLRYANRMRHAWRRVLAANETAPAPFDAMSEATIYLGVANALRGTVEGAQYVEALAEEMAYKAAHGMGSVPDERHRLIFLGVPCYPVFRRFAEFFSHWGGAFVSSTYLWFASGGLDLEAEYDLSDPIRALAEGVLRTTRHAVDAMLFHDRMLLDTIDRYAIDGVVYHPVKSCRTVSTGLADSRRAVLDARDVLCLYLESDMMDRRVVSEAQLKNRIDAFFEGLESRRLRRAGAQGTPAAAGAREVVP